MSTITLNQALENAVKLHRSGQLEQAEKIYRQILGVQPQHADTLHYLGILAHQTGNLLGAVQLMQDAIVQNPESSQYHNNLGNVFRDQQRFADAEAQYRQSLALDPESSEACCNLGTVQRDQGRLEEAVRSYEQAIAIKPYDAGIRSNLGSLLVAQQKIEEALEVCETAVQLDPLSAAAQLGLADVLFRLGRSAEALSCVQKVIETDPSNAGAHFQAGVIYQQNGQPEQAGSSYRQAIALDPTHGLAHQNFAVLRLAQGNTDEAIMLARNAVKLLPREPSAHYNLGGALHAAKRLEDAAVSLREAVRLQPDFAEAWNQLGWVLKDQDQLMEAETALRRAIVLNPEHAVAHINLASVIMPTRLDEALTHGRRSLELDPANPGSRLSLAFMLLLSGKLEEAWPLHESRFTAPNSGSKPRAFPQPKWTGENFAGRRLLLHAEQGFGDSIQFIRYLPQIVERGGEIILECPAGLIPLFKNLDGLSEIIADGSPLPDFDLHIPMLSLPAIFGTTLETVPASVPYLTADPVLQSVWKKKLAIGASSVRPLRVGIAWAGNKQHLGDRFRSAGLERLTPLLSLPGIEFHSLQVGPEAAQVAKLPTDYPVFDHSGELRTFADTAALVVNLDLVISVDTAVAHLAGALGVATWILLPLAPDWRWMRDRSDSPWYPHVRLFRQDGMDDWTPVVEAVRSALAELLEK